MSSSAIEFVSILKRIGCPHADRIDPASLDWLYENESIAAWLMNLSAQINSNSVLSEAELAGFKRLQEDGEGCILEGAELDSALQMLSQAGQDLSADELRADIAVLESKVNALGQEKELFVRERNKLSLQQSILCDKLSKLDAVVKTSAQEQRVTVDEIHLLNGQLNHSLEELVQSVTQLCSVYTSVTTLTKHTATTGGSSSGRQTFFSQLKLDEYHQLEERYTQELTTFTKKLFFDGIGEIAGQHDNTRYEFLDVSNPDLLLVKGERDGIDINDCAELARLQALYPKSELTRIAAIVAEKSKAAACAYAEGISLSDRPLPHDLSELSVQLRERRAENAGLQREITSLSERELPRLVSESSEAQSTHILCGDYDLKIARQNYFTSNQEKVIDWLVSQRARSELLTMVYEVEVRGHRDVSRLLAACRLLLTTHAQHFKSRMVMMEDPCLSTTWQQRSTVDSRDHSTNRIFQLLDSRNSEQSKTSQPWLLSYSKLTDTALAVSHLMTQLKDSQALTNTLQANELSAAETNMKLLQTLVYGGSSTSSHPVLSPQIVAEALSQLDSVLVKLEQAVSDVIRDIEQKKLMLRSDSLLVTERELFVYFFTDPERLRRVVDDVSARLAAQQVK